MTSRPARFPIRVDRAAMCSAGLAIVARLVAVAALHGTPFTRVMVGDAMLYMATATKIISGRVSDIGVFFQSAPLYPFFLAALQSVFGRSWLAVAVVQSIVGAAASAAVAVTARRVFSRYPAAPWIAGFAAALYGPSIYFDMEVLPASLSASLLTLGLLAALQVSSPLRAIAAGALLGVASLLAPSTLLVAVWAAVWLVLRSGASGGRRAVTAAASLLGGLALVVFPVTAHNLLAGDRVLISSNAGINFFIGNNARATGAFYLPPGSGLDGARLESSAREIAEEDRGASLLPSEVSAYWRRRAGTDIRSDPLTWLSLLRRKAMLAINHYEIPNHLNFQFVTRRFVPALSWALPFWIVFGFAVLGVVPTALGRNRAGLLILGVALICLCVPVLFFVTARYRLPAAGPMLILAGGGAAWIVEQLSGRAWRRVAAACALLAALAWASRVEIVREGDFAFDHLLLGDVHRQLGETDDAVVELKLAVETGFERLPGAAVLLARVLERRGNTAEAIAMLDRHLEARPEDSAIRSLRDALQEGGRRDEAPPVPRTSYEIGMERWNRGRDVEGAGRAFESALDLDPAHGPAMVALATLRERQGRDREATKLLRRAVRLAPVDPRLREQLATVLLKSGRSQQARREAEHALKLDPSSAVAVEVLEQLEE